MGPGDASAFLSLLVALDLELIVHLTQVALGEGAQSEPASMELAATHRVTDGTVGIDESSVVVVHSCSGTKRSNTGVEEVHRNRHFS